MQAEGWLMLEAAAHCDVLLPPEFVIELHSAGLMQSCCPAPAAPPHYCWVRFIWFIFCNLWFRIWHVCTTTDFWPTATAAHADAFGNFRTFRRVPSNRYIIYDSKEKVLYYAPVLYIVIAQLRIQHNHIDVKIEEHCKRSISTTGTSLVVAAVVVVVGNFQLLPRILSVWEQSVWLLGVGAVWN